VTVKKKNLKSKKPKLVDKYLEREKRIRKLEKQLDQVAAKIGLKFN